MSRRCELISIACIVLAALAWHAVSLPWQSLFVDEIAELRHTRLGATGVWNNPDSMPPLFTYLLQGWLAIGGSDDAARWLPALCGVASILAVWQLGRELVDAPTGVAAAALWAINPLQLYYSQLVRCYALLALLVAVAMWLFYRGQRTNSWRDWLGFAVASAAGMFTHYYFAILLAIAFGVLVLDRRGWQGTRPTVAFALAGLLATPILSCLKKDFEFQHDMREPRSLNAAALGYTYFSLLGGYSLGPSPAELHALPARDAALEALPWAAALGAAALPLFVVGALTLAQRGRLWSLAAFLFGPVLIVGAAGWATGITYNVRHIAWCGVPLAVWLGAGAAQALQRRWLIPAVGIVAALMLLADYQRNWLPRYQNEDVRSAAAYLAREAAGERVFFLSDYMAGAFRYYAPTAAQYAELPEPGVLSRVVTDEATAREAATRARSLVEPGRRSWLVYSREFHGDPRGLLLEQLEREFALAPEAEFAGVRVFRAAR